MRDVRGGGGRGQVDVDEAGDEGGNEDVGRRGAHVGERQRWVVGNDGGDGAAAGELNQQTGGCCRPD